MKDLPSIMIHKSASSEKNTGSESIFDTDEKTGTWSEWMLHIEPQLELALPHLNKKVVIDQNSRVIFLIFPRTNYTHRLIKGYGELGSRVWDAGHVMSYWIMKRWEMNNNFLQNKRVLELGNFCSFYLSFLSTLILFILSQGVVLD